jgi:hypothetical protein
VLADWVKEKNQGFIKLFAHVLSRMHAKKIKKLMSPLHATYLEIKKIYKSQTKHQN